MQGAVININGKEIESREELENMLYATGSLEHIVCSKNDKALDIEFAESGSAFIGWIDEYDDDVFYFDNGGDDVNPVALKINICPQGRMMCHDIAAVKEIIDYFCEAGERHPKYNWIEDIR